MPKKYFEPRCRVIYGQTWRDYEYVLEERERLGRRYHVNYDRGTLEVALIDSARGRWRALLGSLVTFFMVERLIPFASVGSMLCCRRDMDCGLQLDEGYYIQNELLARGWDLDLEHDPAPDLAIEIESPRPAVDRITILKALGIPEIWRYDGETLTVLVRRGDGGYARAAASQALPTMPLGEFRLRMQTWKLTDQTTWLNDWRAWLGANITPAAK